MTSKLVPYVGPLTTKEIAQGIAAAQANAGRLLEDAKLLLENGRFPTAAALAILAIEERGKVVILKRLAIVSEPNDLKPVWKEYRSHRAKNAGWIIPDLVLKGARTMQAMADALNAGGEHAAVLDALKQIGFYTDCLGDRNWSTPTKVISDDLANSLVSFAEMMWCAREVTERELELWEEHVGPHYAKSSMIQAVVSFQAAMKTEGLSDTEPEELLAFITGKPVDVTGRQIDPCP